MENKIKMVAGWLRNLSGIPNVINAPLASADVVNIREGITEIEYVLRDEHPLICDHMTKVKKCLFANQVSGYMQFTTINPFALGQILECLDLLLVYVQKKNSNLQDEWGYIHPTIIKVSKKLYTDGHYANAAEDAFIEINDRVKRLFRTLNPTDGKIPDGDTAMTTVFSINKPMIKVCDLSTETGVNEQKGLMLMLQGAMSALRNPKAHSNIIISKEDALRRIMFASMLMYKIDEAVRFSQIEE